MADRATAYDYGQQDVGIRRLLRSRLGLSLLVSTVLQVLIPIALVAASVFLIGRDMEVSRALHELNTANATYLSSAEHWAIMVRDMVEVVIGDPEITDSALAFLETGDEAAGEQLLRHVAHVTGSGRLLNKLMLLNREGEVVLSTDPDDVGLDLSTHPLFIVWLTSTKIGTPEYDDETGDVWAYVGTPVRGERGVTGVIVARATLRPMETLLAGEEGAPLTRTTLVLRPDGQLIMAPDDPYSSLVGSVVFDEAIEHLLERESGSLRYVNFNGEDVLAAYNWMSELNIGLITLAPTQNVLEPVWVTVSPALGIGFFGLLAALGLGVLAVYSMVKPVVEMTDAASMIAAGNLQIRVESERKDELGALARAFNSMADQVQGLISTLEARVRRRTRDLETVAEIIRVAVGLRDVDVLLNRTVNLIRERFGFYHAQVFLVDDVKEYAVLRASTGEAGRELLRRGHRLAIGSRSVIGQTTATGKTVIVADTTEPGTVHRPNPLLPDTRAEMALPLKLGDEVIGALDIQSTEPGKFTEEDVRIFQVLADQLAVAISNARLVEETRQRMSEVEELGRRLTRESWGEFLESEPEITGYRYNLIEIEHISPDEPLVSPKYGHDEASTDVIEMPIKLRGEVIGTLVTGGLEGPPSEDELAVVNAITERVAMALENARLFRQIEEALAETRSLYAASSAIVAAEDIDAVLEAVVEQIASKEFDRVLVAFLDDPDAPPEERSVEVRAMWDRLGTISKGNRFSVKEMPLMAHVGPDDVVVSNNIALDENIDPKTRAVFEHLNVKSAAIIPLAVAGKLFGWLLIESTEDVHQFTAREINIFKAIADQAAIAIDNKLLFQQTQDALAEAQALYQGSELLNKATDFDGVVEALRSSTVLGKIDRISVLMFNRPWVGDDAPEWFQAVSVCESGKFIQVPPERYVLAKYPAVGLIPRDDIILVEDVRTSPLLDEETRQVFMHRFKAKSFVAIPLNIGERQIGFITAVSAKQFRLNERDARRLMALSAQAAVVLRNLQLLRSTQEMLDETRRLYETGRAITSATNMEEVVLAVAEHAIPHNADTATLALFEGETSDGPSGTIYIPVDWNRDPNARTMSGFRVPADEFPIFKVLSRQDVTAIEDVQASPDMDEKTRSRLTHMGVRAMLIAPLRIGERWIGILVAGYTKPTKFTETDIRLIRAAADQAAVAVENLRLLEETQVAARRAEALAEAGQLASQIGAEFEIGVQNLFLAVSEPGNYDRWWLGMLESDGETIRGTVGHIEGIDEEMLRQTFPVSEGELSFTRAALERRPVVVNEPADRGLAGALGKHVAVPVLSGDDVIGVLCIGRSPANRDIGDVDVELAATIASHVAVAAENRRLFDAVEAERRNLQEILEAMPVGVVVVDAKTRHPILSNQRAIEMLGAEVDPEQHDQAERYPIYYSGTNEPYRPEEHPFMLALQTGKTIAADDIAVEHPDGTRVELLVNAAPIKDENGEIISVVAVFQDITDIRELETALQESLAEATALYEAGRAVAAAANADEILNVVTIQMSTLNPDMVATMMVEGDSLRFVGAIGEVRKSLSPGTTVPLDSPKMPREHLFDPEALFIEDIQTTRVSIDEALVKHIQASNMRAIASIPIGVRGKVFGRIVMGFKEPHLFDPRERRFALTVIDQASIALENARLLRQTQEALDETALLYSTGRAIAAANDIEGVLNAVVENALIPEIARLSFSLFDEPVEPDSTSLGYAEVVAYWHRDPQEPDLKGLRFSVDDYPLLKLITAGTEEFISHNIDEDERLDDVTRTALKAQGVSALLGVTLRVAHRVIGFMLLSSSAPYRFSERDMRIYRAIADRVAIAIERLRLLQQAEHRALQLETAAELGQVITSILDLDELLPQAVELIKARFGYDHVQVFMLSPDGKDAVLRASTGEVGRKMLKMKHSLPVGSYSVIGQVTARQEPVITLDTSDASMPHKPHPLLPDTRSEMGLPLIARGHLLGALDVQSNHPGAFTDEDVRILSTLAAQIAVAIDNAHLFEEASRRAEEMAFLFRVTREATAAISLEEALQSAAEAIFERMGALDVTILVPDERNAGLKVAARATKMASFEMPSLVPFDRGIAGWVASTREPLMVNDVTANDRYLEILPATKSELAVPLVSGDELLGVINIESDRPNAFTDEDMRLVQTLATSLTAIVQNTRLLEELRHANEQLRELDRLKSQFLANMSHELRTPLNSIIGFSRVMLKGIDGPLTDLQRQDLTTIHESGQHLLGLINDMLDQSKIEAGKMELTFEYFPIERVIKGVMSTATALVKDKPIELRLEIPDDLPNVWGDEFRTRQILLNLVSNAAKFTEEGSITISAFVTQEDGDKFLQISVSDTGIGIAEEDMDRIFEAFLQVDSSTTRKVGGTGLGLPISKSLVELQGGRIWVESELGVGSTFSFTVPLHPREEPQEKPETPEEPASAEEPIPESPPEEQPATPRKRVVVIDDEPGVIDLYRRYLMREGYEVIGVTDPDEAERTVVKYKPSVVLLDVAMPGRDGWDVLAHLKDDDATFEIPVIVCSIVDDAKRGFQLGASEYLVKPFLGEDLVEAIRRVEAEMVKYRILITGRRKEDAESVHKALLIEPRYEIRRIPESDDWDEVVGEWWPDLVILAPDIPDEDGAELLERIRENPKTAEVPVIVIVPDELPAERIGSQEGVSLIARSDSTAEKIIDEVARRLGRGDGSRG